MCGRSCFPALRCRGPIQFHLAGEDRVCLLYTSGTSGTFYLQWRENGVRRTRPVGTSPREALDAWQLHSGILVGEIEGPEEEAAPKAGRSMTIRAAVDATLRR